MWEATDFNEFPSNCAAKVEWSRQCVRAWSTREAVHRSEARRMSVSEVRNARRQLVAGTPYKWRKYGKTDT